VSQRTHPRFTAGRWPTPVGRSIFGPMTVTPAPPSPAASTDAPAGAPPAAPPGEPPAHTANETLTRRDLILRWGAVLATLAIILAVPVPDGIAPKSWHLLAIFLGTIVGSIVRPVPAGAIVFLGVAAVAFTGTLTPTQALGGYADPIVWLVLCAFFISRGVVKTGLGRRIALVFIRAIGHRSIGLAYALVATDTLLASLVPSNGARAGGVVFPVAKSLAEAYDSTPGPTRRRLGAYLMTTVYQCDVIACAMFLTGQASNVLIAKFAKDVAGVDLSYARWFVGGIVPGLLCLLLVPLVLFKIFPPDVRRTPGAAAFAATELGRLGRMSRGERIMLIVFALIAGLWMSTSWHQINYAVIALGGICALLLTNVLTWEDVVSERSAWDVYIWYGGLVQMAAALGETGITKRFAEAAAGVTGGWMWGAALAVLLLIYFYAHYGFASITAHATAMYTPFLVVTIAAGAPPMLAALSLAYFSNLDASLTHYGTTPAPIYFGSRYVTQREWWKYGFIVSLVTIAIWSTIGVGWWKLLGWW
jgi:divalent anion:Na+ symporter, DASS family